ncbi:MAG: phage holin family protein [Bdellovibrionales bacterium]|nr:phage holin family protein [Bdellovibrionales bacterium]
MVAEMSWLELLAHWVVSAVALSLTSALVPGFKMKGFSTAMVAALFIAVANFFVRPFLVFLTFPLTILTLGFFLFVVDAIILRLSAAFLKDFEISGWFSAIIGAIVLSLTGGLLHWLFI